LERECREEEKTAKAIRQEGGKTRNEGGARLGGRVVGAFLTRRTQGAERSLWWTNVYRYTIRTGRVELTYP
jgi:hypothetical protein